MNEFEKQLSRQPWKSVPPEWRSGILQAAHAKDRPDAPFVTRSLWPLLLAWLWPQPRAWAALGALWIIIAAVHLATPGNPPVNQSMKARVSLVSVAEQRRELAELIGSASDANERSPADRPRSARNVPPGFPLA